MNTKRYFYMLCTLLLFSINTYCQSNVSNTADQVQEFTLIPGDSATVHGIQIEWLSEERENEEVPGTNLSIPKQTLLNIRGPKTQLTRIDFSIDLLNPFDVNFQQVIPGQSTQPTNHLFTLFIAYIDNVSLSFKMEERTLHSQAQLFLRGKATLQSDEIPFTGAPSGGNYYVSFYNPITLDGQFQLSVAEIASPTNELTGDYELHVKDLVSGEVNTMPLVNSVSKIFQRFQIMVNGTFSKSTRTAELYIKADADYSIQGGDTFTKEALFARDNENLGDLIERISQRYNIQVEWVAPEEYQDAIIYYKEKEFNPMARSFGAPNGYVVQTAVNSILRIPDPDPKLEWLDAHHLRIDTSPAIPILEKQREEERKKREQEEEAKRVKEEAERELELSKQNFQRIYPLVTTVYPLQNITPITAKTLVDPHLSIYLLKEKRRLITDRIQPIVLNEGKYYHIVLINHSEKNLLDSINLNAGLTEDITYFLRYSNSSAWEKSVADEKGNVLIVTATPQTHEKVREILAQIDGETQEAKTAVPNQYRIEVVLLSSGNSGLSIQEITEKYNIQPDDLKLFKLDSLQERSKSVMQLSGEKGEIGTAQVQLGNHHSIRLEFMDLREPYLVVRGTLQEQVDRQPKPVDHSANEPSAREKVLLQNTLFLEKDKPTLLGLTNLNEALILLLKRVE